ncbi:Gfo/Idh/MocA family oxidoreductase [Alphaproteobacteria bacterium]|nr:Gfo/Idh/MocA family oxidoreductase [Alphaproteobacteria bacterium]
MKVVIIGLGVQGKKRKKFAGKEVSFTVDPVSKEADFKSIEEVPIDSYDAALCCIPDAPKFEIIKYLLKKKKHVLVEKPLYVDGSNEISELKLLAKKNKVVCYTAYNHRFEPHFMRAKEMVDSGVLGKIYSCRMFYGNGTARLVQNSPWRDQGSGVIHDLGSHLLDTLLFFFGDTIQKRHFNLRSCHRFENNSPDYAAFSSEETLPRLDCEMTMVSWRNSFYCDIYGEKGSLHIDSFCKWGPNTFTFRKRILPSGKPEENPVTLEQPDPTWEAEYTYFKKLCTVPCNNNTSNDQYIFETLEDLKSQMV